MTLIQQIEQLQAENATLKTAQADLTARAEKAEKTVAESAVLLAKTDEAVKAADLELKAEKTAHEATKAKLAETVSVLDKAKAALANPAHMAAAVDGLKTATAEGGTPASEEPMTKEQAMVAYNKLPDGMEGAKARADFRAQHGKLLGL